MLVTAQVGHPQDGAISNCSRCHPPPPPNTAGPEDAFPRSRGGRPSRVEHPASPSARNGKGRAPVRRPGAGPPDRAKGPSPASALRLEELGELGERGPALPPQPAPRSHLPNKHRRRWSWSKNNGHSDAGARLMPDPRCARGSRADRGGEWALQGPPSGPGGAGRRRGWGVSHSDSRNARSRVVSQGLVGTRLATPSRHPALPGGQHRKQAWPGCLGLPGTGKASLQSTAGEWTAALRADSGLLVPSTGGAGWCCPLCCG